MFRRLRTRLSRLRFVLSRRRLDEEASLELQSHLELLADRYIDAGMTPDAARRAAARQLGNVTLVREDIHRMNSVRWLEALGQDLRYAFRVFRRNPSFAAVVIATLALGIGANTAILSVVYSVLLKPLPYERPGQIYSVEIIIPERREQIPSLPATVQTYLAWRSARTPFSAMAAMRPWEASLTGDAEPERLGGARVSANFFSFLGVPLAHGRGFAGDEELPGKERVVVISDALWHRRYGANPDIVGRSILINGESHVVVGIAPATLLVPTGTQLHPLVPFAPRVDIWKPIAPMPNELRNESWDHGVLVRLPDSGDLERGRQQLADILNEQVRVQRPKVKIQAVVQLVPARDLYSGPVRLRLLLVLAASALLLLTACASAANVVLARGASRAHEFATRIALGARRARILSQSLTETIVLAMLGGAMGALLAGAGVRLLAAYGPDDVRVMTEARVNLPLLGFAILVSVLTGIVCGMVPAWHAFRVDPGAHLQDAARTVGGRRAGRSRQLLVGVEIALATLLLASAGLLLRSFVNVMNTGRGYDVEHVLAVDLSPFGPRYATPAARAVFYNGLLERVRGLPGVVAAGAISNLPAVAASVGASRTILYPTDTSMQSVMLFRPVAPIRSVTAGYFSASGTTLLAGRFFADDEPALVAVVTESLASRLWPGELPPAILGRQIRSGDASTPLITVAGVAGDARTGGLDRAPAPDLYRPYPQWPSGPMTVIVRSAQDPAALALAVRTEIRRLDANLPIATIRTMEEIVSSAVAPRRFQVVLTSLFGIVALLLGAVGVYGVVSYAVACRTRDIGLRIALGAVSGDVMRLVFSQGMRPVLAGLACGLSGAIAAATALRSVLFGVAPADPVSLAAVALVLVGASSLACYLPARRAASLDPTVALRHE